MNRDKESRVLEAATTVFLRYGFRRTTMGDIAKATGISRPALYLLFCNKERVFEAVFQRLITRTLEEIQARAAELNTPLEKLRLAFEWWAVRPFTLMLESPDARDLIHGGCTFAAETLARSYRAFEAQLVQILETLPRSPSAVNPQLDRIAHVLATSVHGFKETAKSVEELKDMIEVLLDLTITSLGSGGTKA
jgi:AcrR family transcriptional regulator